MIPLTLGVIKLHIEIKHKGIEYFEKQFVNKFDNTTTVGILLTLILLFSFLGDVIINNPFHTIDCSTSYYSNIFNLLYLHLSAKKLK